MAGPTPMKEILGHNCSPGGRRAGRRKFEPPPDTRGAGAPITGAYAGLRSERTNALATRGQDPHGLRTSPTARPDTSNAAGRSSQAGGSVGGVRRPQTARLCTESSLSGPGLAPEAAHRPHTPCQRGGEGRPTAVPVGVASRSHLCSEPSTSGHLESTTLLPNHGTESWAHDPRDSTLWKVFAAGGTRHNYATPASEVAEHILVHHACEEPPRKPAPKPVPFSDAARAALAAQHAELRSSYEISRLHQVGSTVFKDLDYPA